MHRIEVFKTLSILTAAFLVGFFVFEIKLLLVIALLLVIGSAFESRITTLFARYWLKFAHAIGRVNSRIVLSLVFYLVLTPIAVIYRLFSKRSVDNFISNKRESYFDDINTAYKKESFEKLW